MKLINLEQRTDAWFQWRKAGLTASEMPVILGVSPYQTPWRLWAEKVGIMEHPDLSNNPNVQRGIRLEDGIRERIAQEMCDIIEPACAEWDGDSLFRASFDGLTSEGIPVEIKAPSVSTFEDVKQQGEYSNAYRMYSVQVQHQMLVADAPYAWLCFFCNDELLKFKIERDDALILEILDEGRAFWKLIETHTEPVMDPERDMYIPHRDDDIRSWLIASKEYNGLQIRIDELKASIRNLENRQNLLKNSFKKQMGSFTAADFGGMSVRHSFAKGRIDYRKVLQDQLGEPIDEGKFEKYRSKASERWIFRVSDSVIPKGLLPEETVKEAELIKVPETFWF